MKLGIFVNKQHINFIAFISFLTAQISEYTDIHIKLIDNQTLIKDIELFDINIIINRYCYIRLNKLFNKKYLKHSYLLPCYHNKSIAIFPKDLITNDNENLNCLQIIETISDKYHKTLNRECALYNIGCVNSTIANATFLCYDDTSDNFIEFLKEYHYKNKRIYFNNKIYTINPNKNFFKYKDTDACKISSKVTIYWDKQTNEWKRLNK